MRLGKVSGKQLDCYLCKTSITIKEGEDGCKILEAHLREEHHRLLLEREEIGYGCKEYVYRGRYLQDDLPAFLYRD